jgi:hypothetical protein
MSATSSTARMGRSKESEQQLRRTMGPAFDQQLLLNLLVQRPSTSIGVARRAHR